MLRKKIFFQAIILSLERGLKIAMLERTTLKQLILFIVSG